MLSAGGGGYRAVANCIERGGIEISEVYLFNSLYGREDSFRDWLLAGASEESPRQRRKLISFFRDSSTVSEKNHSLMSDLEDASMHYVLEARGEELSRAEFIRQRAVFIETGLSHGAIVRGHNNFRDCLYASSLRTRVHSDWFDNLEGGRLSDSD